MTRRNYGLRPIVDLAQRPPARWPWRHSLTLIVAFCAGAWIAIAFLIGQVVE
jgi:hypothetical protein